jgi:hypothetical protein
MGSGLVTFSLVKQLGDKTKCAVTWLYVSCVPVFHQARAQGLVMGGIPNRSNKCMWGIQTLSFILVN